MYTLVLGFFWAFRVDRMETPCAQLFSPLSTLLSLALDSSSCLRVPAKPRSVPCFLPLGHLRPWERRFALPVRGLPSGVAATEALLWRERGSMGLRP